MKSKLNKFFAWIIVLLLVLGLVGFGLQDVLSRWGTSKLATVGDIEISTKEFSQNFIREVNYISQDIGKNLSIDEAKSIGIHLSVLERLINRSLLDQLIKDLNISIGDENLLKEIKSNINFQGVNGEFNRNNYNLFLQQLELKDFEFENILRNDLSREFINQIFDIKLKHNQNIIKTVADFIGEQRKISFYKLKSINPVTKLNITDLDLKDYYELNKENYKTKTIRKFSILKLDKTNMIEDILINNDEITNIYNERIEEFSKPEIRQFNRIIFQRKEEAIAALESINEKKKTLTDVANDLNLSKKELNFGSYSKEDFEINLGNIIFDINKSQNEIIGPIESDLGFELYEIVKIIPAKKLEPIAAKKIIREEIKTEKFVDKLAEIIPIVEDKIASGDTLENISEEFSLSIDKIIKIEGEELPKNYGKNLEIFFENASYENSDLIQLDSNYFISIRLDEEIKPEIPSFLKIKKEIAKDFKKEKKIIKLEENLKEILNNFEFENALNLNKIDFLYNEDVRRGSNTINFLKQKTIEKIFSNSIGEYVTEKIIDTNHPYILILKTEEIVNANRREDYKIIIDNLNKQINDQLKNDILVLLLSSLRTRYKPKVNYTLVDQIISNIQ